MEKNTARVGAKPAAFGWLFRTKSLDSILADAEEPEHQLRRTLGPVQLTLFGVGAIIGAGIFTTIGTAAAGDPFRPGAGPALMLSFVITAVACGFTALCYAEFAAMVPISGSAYTYSYATLGELIAWIIGWDLIIEYAVGNIAVAIGWASYFNTFLQGFGINLPVWLLTNYRTASPEVIAAAPHIYGVPIVFNLLAVFIVAIITIFLVWGIRESANFNAAMVVVKLLVLIFFIVVGLNWIKADNWAPFAPNGWKGLSAGAAIIFFAYIGFDAVSTVAEETREPQRSLPIGIIASLVICTVLYVVIAAVFTGLIPYDALQSASASERAEPLTLALKYVGFETGWAVLIVAFGSVVAQTAVLLVFQLGQPRIFMSMSRDGLLPGVFRKVHPRFRTPHISTILTGVFVAAFAALASIDEVVDLTNIGTLFAFILVCAGIIVLRIKEPNRPRPFRAPGGLALPIFGIISCLYLVYFLPPTSWLRFAAWLNFGFVIYVAYGAVHSRLTGRGAGERPYLHDARTARIGALLLLIGAALLVLTRAADLLAGALREKASTSTFDTLFSGQSWLSASAFMLLPLGLNALILCPIVIQRAARARSRAAAEGGNVNTVGAQAIGVIFLLAVILYFILVAVSNSAA